MFYFVFKVITKSSVKREFSIRQQLVRIFSRFDGELFENIGSSKFEHFKSKIANYRERALVTGCSLKKKKCGSKTEILDVSTFKW